MQNIRTNLLGIISSVIFVILALLIVVSILIGVYHASTVLIAYSLAPVFTILIPAATILLCGGVVFLAHPVHNLLCLICVFFSTVALYLHVGAEFLAFLFLIVYVGAIAILFLFVIMLLQLKVVAATSAPFASLRAKLLGATAFITVFGLIDTLATSLSEFFAISNVGTFKATVATTENLVWYVNNQFSDILLFSDVLYTYHCFLFFIAGLLLLTAMLGAIILATSATDNTAD